MIVGSVDHTRRWHPWAVVTKRGDYAFLVDTNDHHQSVDRRLRRSLECSGRLIIALYAS
jgi:hypothetical protein